VLMDEKLNIVFLPLTTTFMFVPRFCGSLGIHRMVGHVRKNVLKLYIFIHKYINIHVYIYIYAQ
jgi:hypothetical protein